MRLYLWKPDYDPYNLSDRSHTTDGTDFTSQYIEFTEEYVSGEIINPGDWREAGDAVVETTIPVPFGKMFNKSNGKVYIDLECYVPRHSSVQVLFFDKHKQKRIIENPKKYTTRERTIYEFNMPKEDTIIQISSRHDSDCGAYFKCYGIYTDIKISKSIKKAVLEKLRDEKLVEKRIMKMIAEKQGEQNDGL